MPVEDKLLLTPDEVCDQLGVKRSHLWKMLSSGELPSLKLGKLRRIPAEGLKDWLQRRLEDHDEGVRTDEAS